MRIRILKGFWTSGLGLTILGVIFAVFLTSVGVFAFYYSKYARMIEIIWHDRRYIASEGDLKERAVPARKPKSIRMANHSGLNECTA